jgi:archaellum component FlaC
MKSFECTGVGKELATPEIPEELQKLSCEIEVLEKNFNKLTEKLIPVRYIHPTDERVMDDSPTLTPIAEIVSKLRSRVKTVNQDLVQVIDEVQL